MVALRQYTPPQEYLTWERKAETRSEYHDGVIVAMAGASWKHNRIVSNLLRHLGNDLDQKDCIAVANDMRVVVPECHRYFYPDVVIVCGEAEFEDADLDTLTNPTLIIEVLSDSTERADRRSKWDCYRALPSLRTYVLAAQDEPRIETFTRHGEGAWTFDVARGLDAVASLPAIGCALRLADAYARITFAPIPDADAAASEADARPER